MTDTRSIATRLIVLLAAAAALLSLLSWGMVTGLAQQATQRAQDNVLAASAFTIVETLRSEQGELRLELPYAAFAMLDAISEDRVFYRVTAGDDVLTGYADLPPAGVGRMGQVVFDTGFYNNVVIRMASVTRGVLVGNEQVAVTVTVGQTRDGVGQIASELSRLAAALAVAFFVVAVGLSLIAVRASLRPLNEIAAAVARRGPSDLRPLLRPAPADLAPLLTALNRLMERLKQSIRRSEDFIAEAAHRIRTPLATVRVQAEIALRSVSDETEKERLRRIIRAVDESSRSAGQLLDHATVAYRSENLTRARLDLADLAAQTVAGMEPTAAMRDIRIDLQARSTVVLGDAVLLENALRNVLDNAIKYSPEETIVTLSVGQQGGQAQIKITDQGAGFGDGSPQRLVERFRRGSNTAGVIGSGLGLTIAAEVLGAHGGHLELTTATKGTGACVCLVLPLA